MGKMKAKSEEAQEQAMPCCASIMENSDCDCGEPTDAELTAIEVDLDYQAMLSEFAQEGTIYGIYIK